MPFEGDAESRLLEHKASQGLWLGLWVFLAVPLAEEGTFVATAGDEGIADVCIMCAWPFNPDDTGVLLSVSDPVGSLLLGLPRLVLATDAERDQQAPP